MAKPKRVLYVCPKHSEQNPHQIKRMFPSVELMPSRNAMSKYIFFCSRCGSRMKQRPELEKPKKINKKEQISDLIISLQNLE